MPETQFVDTGYLNAELLFESKEKYGVDLFGPTRPDRKWQAKEGTGFEAAAFSLDWEEKVAICPEGKRSISWTPAIDNRHNRVVKIKFSSKDCMPCPSREKCIRSTRRWKRRSVTVRADGHQQALEAARSREKEPGFAAAYARRSNREGMPLEAQVDRGRAGRAVDAVSRRAGAAAEQGGPHAPGVRCDAEVLRRGGTLPAGQARGAGGGLTVRWGAGVAGVRCRARGLAALRLGR